MIEKLIVSPQEGISVPEVAVFLIDKPKGWTSFDVVAKMRRLLKIKKIGHAGTLDPMATGLLMVCVGREATKQIATLMGLDKVYQGTLRLGETTASYDAETPVIERKEIDQITDELLEHAKSKFLGEIEQRPPLYSALKINGERLYKKARRGESFVVPKRIVHIHQFSILERTGQDVNFIVKCSKGTYIRSLAHDFGQVLGVGAHLVALRRIQIGTFSVDDAWQLALLEQALPKIEKHA